MFKNMSWEQERLLTQYIAFMNDTSVKVTGAYRTGSKIHYQAVSLTQPPTDVSGTTTVRTLEKFRKKRS